MERLVLENQIVTMRALLAVVTTDETRTQLLAAIRETQAALAVWSVPDAVPAGYTAAPVDTPIG